MKRSLKNLSVFILIFLLLIASGIGVMPARAASFMEIVPLSLPSGWSSGHLYEVWGSSATDVYAVGYGDSENATVPLLYHNNGSGWSGSGLPLPSGWTSGYLFSVWGSSASDVYVVGSGYAGGKYQPLLYRYDGSIWTPLALSLPVGWSKGYLYGVWGSGSGDVYAVGYGNNGTALMPLIYHYNGSGWSGTSPTLPTGWISANLRGVWGSAANDIYAAGYGNNGTNTAPVLYHYNGSGWSEASPARPAGWISASLHGVWGTSASDVHAVGYGDESTTMPLLYHNAGGGWARSPVSLPVGWNRGYLRGVWGSGASDVYSVGSGNNGNQLLPLLYHSDGNIWSDFSPSLPGGWDFGYLEGVWGSAAGDVYVVGTGNDGNVNRPLLYHSSQSGQDLLAPGDIANFSASAGTDNGSATLSWTAPADDANNTSSGRVASYLVRYSTFPFSSWNDGIAVSTGVPVPTAPGTTQTMQVQGLLPGVLYYFAIRAQDDQYNFSTNYATTSGAARATAVGGGTYDDTHSAWSYSGNWTSAGQLGPYNNTDHYTNVQGGSATITFVGTQFTVYFTQYTNRGDVEVWIDGQQRYSFSELGSAVAWQQSWTLPEPLAEGTHTVQFKKANAGTSTYIDVDAITILGSVGPGTYDDTHVAWSYLGNWTAVGQTGPYSSTDHYTNMQGASAAITFIGTQFTVYFTQYTNRGDVEVWIDGQQRYSFSELGSAVAWQQSWTLPEPLAEGTHTVQFKKANAGTSTYIDADAINIQ
jgi:hypothetical protein